MGVVVNSDELRELVDADSAVESIGSGFIFTEGPIWHAEEEFLLFSDMPGDVRRRCSEADGVSEVMRRANSATGWSTTPTATCSSAST